MNMLAHITELRRAAAELEDLTDRVQRQVAALAELHTGRSDPEPDHSLYPTRQLPNGLCVPITPAGFDLLFSLVEHQHALLNSGTTASHLRPAATPSASVTREGAHAPETNDRPS